jgi:peptidyl-prolyl cis-trans isomerase A (cyclophilin A)
MISITVLLTVALGLGTCLTLSAVAAQVENKKPLVVFDTSAGQITLELDPEKAPVTVENFLKYVDDGFYDNLIFHRIIPGFMIQGGGMNDRIQDKKEGVRPSIKNESGNGLHNARGTIAMARTDNPNSATCQFFINHADNPRLDTLGGGYAVFGKVVEGMEVVDAIAKAPTTTRGYHENVPIKPIYIKSARRKTK